MLITARYTTPIIVGRHDGSVAISITFVSGVSEIFA
jgi:hypothetical protein